MTPIRSSKLSPSVESLRSFRPRPTETSSGSATSHSIVNAIWSSASSICSSTSAPSPHVTTSLREISSPGCSWLPLQSSSTEYRPLEGSEERDEVLLFVAGQLRAKDQVEEL